jgi:hypothetical protein
MVQTDPELAYLALLTARSVKPLSRWEKNLPAAAETALISLGLQVRSIPRRVEQGRITEVVFSRSVELTECYTSGFSNQPVRKTPDVARVEGSLFGYPGCCVEAFVDEPYRPNGLPESDQRILFHWACPNCAVTPLILPHYRWAHGVIEELSPGFGATAGRTGPGA